MERRREDRIRQRGRQEEDQPSEDESEVEITIRRPPIPGGEHEGDEDSGDTMPLSEDESNASTAEAPAQLRREDTRVNRIIQEAMTGTSRVDLLRLRKILKNEKGTRVGTTSGQDGDGTQPVTSEGDEPQETVGSHFEEPSDGTPSESEVPGAEARIVFPKNIVKKKYW